MISFQTKNGNNYAFDRHTGLIIPYDPILEDIQKIINWDSLSKEEIIEKLSPKFTKEEIIFAYTWLNKWIEFKNQNKNIIPFNNEFNINDLKMFLMGHGFKQIILSITEDCNFRCEYCAYSDNYETTRLHSKKYMNFKTAKSSLDIYLNFLKKGKKYNPLRFPVIGFYGGEPLLNFDLIKECVEYLNGKWESFQFNITTNGSLLDKKKSDWLIENNFMINVSIDGPKYEHDRKRKDLDGKPTFNKVMKNVKYVMNKKYDKIFSVPVFDWKTDLFQVEKFFENEKIPPILSASIVENDINNGYYKQFSEEDYENFKYNLKLAEKEYYTKKSANKKDRNSLFHYLIGNLHGKEIYGCECLSFPNPIIPVSGSCVPGEKVFVNVSGDFHICERVPEKFPIGNANEGLNFEKIHCLVKDYMIHMDKCFECEVEKKCNKCFKQFITKNNTFYFSSKICENVESEIIDSLKSAISSAEEYPHILQEFDVKHENIKKFYEDYICILD